MRWRPRRRRRSPSPSTGWVCASKAAAVTSRRALPRLLLVTGMSGAGKSTVLDALEDMGWDTVDNLPADLLTQFVHGGEECRTADVAIGMDVRSRGFDPEHLPEQIHGIEGVHAEMLY